MAHEISHSFPPEIICEILLKASVKSLLRCKSVCKAWYTLISDKHFIKSHYTLSSTNNNNYQHHRLIYSTFEYDKYDRPRSNLISCPLYDALFDKSANNAVQLEHPLQLTRYQRIRIAGSCNGLVCLFLDDDDYDMFIYNPTTRRSNIFPCFKRTGSSRVYYGFGYDELSSDYKVVITGIEPKMDTIIYSLKTGKWKEIGHFPCARPLYNGKLLNGALHWVASDNSTSLDSCKIVSLDLAKETYGEVLQPENRKGNGHLDLGVSGEWLCVLYDYWESRTVDVWVMKVYGVKDSWTKLASIPPTSPFNISWPTHWWRHIWAPLCISKDGKLLLKLGLQLIIYDSKDSSSSVIENKCDDACIVVESLVSPFLPLGLADNNDDED